MRNIACLVAVKAFFKSNRLCFVASHFDSSVCFYKSTISVFGTYNSGIGIMSRNKIDDPKTIGARLRYYRESINKTGMELSEIVGISQGSISDIENNKCQPSTKTLVTLIRTTDINIEWLLTGEGKERTEKLPTQNEIHPKIQRFIAPIISDIEMWLKDAKGKEPMIESWFEVELKMKFPAFSEWCEKKRQALSTGTLQDDEETEKIKKVS